MLFGGATVLQLHAQAAGIGLPGQALSALPYLATILALVEELSRTKRELQKERDKEVCPDCRGRGRLVYNSGDRSVDTQCDKCSGEGYCIPR